MPALPEKMQVAMTRLVYKRPYIASAILSMITYEKPGLGTMAVDQWWRLYYDPDAIERWDVDEIVGVLYHEVWHLLRDHPERGMHFDNPMLWNVSADLELNSDIEREGMVLPEGGLFPKEFGLEEGLTAEVYYDILSKMGGSGGGGIPLLAIPDPSLPKVGAGNCGSCATGVRAPWEDGPPSEDSPGVSKEEGKLIARKVAQEIANAKTKGSVPDHASRWAESILKPKVDWRRELASAVRHSIADAAGMVDYTYRRPSRRRVPGVVLPALRRPIVDVAVVIDTSGSMNEDDLNRALSELGGILKATQVGVTVLSVDAAVHSKQLVHSTKDVRLEGGGGTNMALGIEEADKLGADVIVVLTDGLTDWPSKPPKAKTVICQVGEYGSNPPKWAKRVIVPTEGV